MSSTSTTTTTTTTTPPTQTQEVEKLASTTDDITTENNNIVNTGVNEINCKDAYEEIDDIDLSNDDDNVARATNASSDDDDDDDDDDASNVNNNDNDNDNTVVSSSSDDDDTEDDSSSNITCKNIEEREMSANSITANTATMNDAADKASRLETENTRLNIELDKLRVAFEQSRQREALSTSRLNESRKKEAMSSQLSSKHKQNESNLTDTNIELKKQLHQEQKSKEKLESTIEKIKIKTIEKINSLQEELVQERNWNDERKQKMKMFIQTKANELSNMNESNEQLNKELQQTRLSLRSVRCDYDATLTKVKEYEDNIKSLTETIDHLQKNTSQLLVGKLEYQKTLELTEKETEEHKVKRLTAKHELMTVLRKLEAEQSVGNQLRDMLKSTYVPKALSQQQLLSEGNALLLECIDKMNFPASTSLSASASTSMSMPSTINNDGISSPDNHNHNHPNYLSSSTSKGNSQHQPLSLLDTNTKRLLNNLEIESQKVSKNIMLLLSTVEQLQQLITERNKQKGCVESLSFWLGAGANNTATTNNVTNHDNEDHNHDADILVDDESMHSTRTRNRRGERRDKHKYGYIPNTIS